MADHTTSIVTLRAAEVGIRSDGELWGAILVEPKDGKVRMFSQCLPQYPHLDPPGWGAIADLTGVSATEVVASWDDNQLANQAAERAFTLLQDHIGRRFIATEIDGVAGEIAVELVPVQLDDPTVRLNLDEGVVTQGPTELQFTRIIQVYTQSDVTGVNPPYLMIISESAAPCALRVPHKDFSVDPSEWFFVETFTGIPAGKIAYVWENDGGREVNRFATAAEQQMAQLLIGRQAPMTIDGQLHLNYLRRALVQERFAQGVEPILFVGRNPKVVVQGSWTLLQDVYGAHLFRYNVERGANSGLPAALRKVDGKWKLEVLDTKEKMRGMLFTAIDFCGSGSPKSPAVRHVAPPNVVSEHMILFANQDVPPIDTLSRIPTIRADGSIHDTEGYDPKSRIWYAPEIQLEPIPERPTVADIRKAKAIILEPFEKFPFVEEAGAIAGTVACLLDQIVRPMIGGPRPLYAFDAPALKGQGTGKTLLAIALGTIITGREMEVTAWPDDPKDLPKLITSKLMQSEPFVVLDNLEGTVRHKDLAAVATSTMWSSRLLHTNDAPKLPNTTTWCTTLNGARFSRDIARRTITIKLDARMEDPYKRKGFQPLVPFCLRNRAQIIRACLIIARAWVVAGCPVDDRLVAGSFEAWQKVVGGILFNAGIKDLPLAVEESRGRDIDATEHDEFVMHWATQFGGQQVTALQLAALAELYNIYGSVLEKVKAPNWKGRHMAEILRKLHGHAFNGWRVVKHEQRVSGQFVYSLVPADQPAASLN